MVYNVEGNLHMSTKSTKLTKSYPDKQDADVSINHIFAVTDVLLSNIKSDIQIENLNSDDRLSPFGDNSALQIYKRINVGNILSDKLAILTADGIWYPSSCVLKRIPSNDVSFSLCFLVHTFSRR